MNMGSACHDNQDQIKLYLNCLLAQRKLSPHTITSYRCDLQQLIALSQQVDLAALTSSDIRRVTSKLHAKGLNPRSISRKLSAWRGYYQWLIQEMSLANNPVDDIHAPKKNKPLPKALTVDDAVRLVATTPKNRINSKINQDILQCNQAMFELLYSSGLRVSELTGLDIHAVHQSSYTSSGWINLNEKEVTVTGKGNKQRIIPVGDAAINAIKYWQEIRTQYLQKNNSLDDQFALFINTRGRRISSRIVQLRLKAHARMLGLPMNVHPHILRHSFASHLLQSSGDLRAVQDMLGHASIVSTQIYTALDFQHLARIYDAAHPRAKTKKNL